MHVFDEDARLVKWPVLWINSDIVILKNIVKRKTLFTRAPPRPRRMYMYM